MSISMSEGDAVIAARLRMIRELEAFLAAAANASQRRIIPTKRPTRSQLNDKSWSWYQPNASPMPETKSC